MLALGCKEELAILPIRLLVERRAGEKHDQTHVPYRADPEIRISESKIGDDFIHPRGSDPFRALAQFVASDGLEERRLAESPPAWTESGYCASRHVDQVSATRSR